MKRSLQLLAVLITAWTGNDAEAKIMKIEITDRALFADGTAFGAAGAYERLTGVAHGEVDPADPRNKGIVNLDKAKRNANGKVEYDTNFFILRPADPAKGNGGIIYEVNNRGMKLLGGSIMGAVPNPANPLASMNDPRTVADVGDGLLLKLGYTLVSSGWDPNAPRAFSGLAMDAPVALQNGAPIEREIRDEFTSQPMIPGPPVFRLSYETVSLDNEGATLTMRWQETRTGTEIPRDRWRFADNRTLVLLPEGTKPETGALYELHYKAKAPQVTGLGFAATRDLVSYLRHAPDSPTPGIRRTITIGISQSGRFLRSFVSEGFNRDESGGKVFDGVLSYIGGGGKVFLNAEFSQAFRTNTQYTDHYFPDGTFPYSTARTKDPANGREGSMLHGDGSDPLLMEANSSTEYWQKGASLISTDPQGNADVALPATVRAYFLSGVPHAPMAMFQSDLIHPVNMLNSDYALRALLLRLDAWVDKGETPPASVIPRLDQNTLVRRADLHFPAVPDVAPPPSPNVMVRIADWVEKKPAPGPQLQSLVPQADADGQDLGGVRLPEVAVPLGTSTGWNLYKGDERKGQMGSLVGSFFPFAKTKAERLAKGDPRPSLEERYAGKDDYVAKFRKAVDVLVAQGFVRAEDADRYADTANKTTAFN